MKKFSNSFSLVLFFLLMPGFVFSQFIKLKKADELFDKYYYKQAISLYETVVEKDKNNFHAVKRLADCYRLVRNSVDAESFYRQLIEAKKHQSIDLYFFASALKSNQRYDEAEKWFQEYKKANAKDTRVQTTLTQEELYMALSRDSFLYDIRLLNINTDKSDMSPAFFNDQIVFSAPRNNTSKKKNNYGWNDQSFLDLIIADIDLSGGLIEAENKFPKIINSLLHEANSCYDPIDSIIYFTRNNIKGKRTIKSEDDVIQLKILSAKFSNGKWSDIQEFKYNDDQYSTGHPTLSKNYDTLYFVSEKPGGMGGTDIYYCEKMSDDWGTPRNMGRLVNTEGDEMFPFKHQSGVLFFASDGHAGLGGLDIFKLYYDRNGSRKVSNLGYPINSSKDDFSLIMSEDTKSGYFTSNRPGGFGDDDLYHIWFRDLPKMIISGVVKDEDSKIPIPGALVKLKNPETDGQDVVVADDKGRFSFEVGIDKNYNLLASKEKYTKGNLDVFTHRNRREEMKNLEILLDYTFLRLEGFVHDKETNEPVEDAYLILRNPVSFELINLTTDGKGYYTTDLKPKSFFKIRVEKHKYFAANGQVVTNDVEKTTIRKDFILEKIDLTKSIKLENIYYDLGKWNIRDDAAIELDKIVKLLFDNPTLTIELSSHTDCRGSAKSNQSLSQKRAVSAVKYIASKGIDEKRMKAKGYGEEKLVNHCKDGVQCSKAEHQENRRTEMQILTY